MDENAVVRATCDYLTLEGYEILEQRTTVEKGIDIVAKNLLTGVTAFVEAKGNTSSRKGSPRSGKDFDSSQVLNRSAKGVFTCLQLRAQNSDRASHKIILAVPNSELFNYYLNPLKDSLEKAGVEILFI